MSLPHPMRPALGTRRARSHATLGTAQLQTAAQLRPPAQSTLSLTALRTSRHTGRQCRGTGTGALRQKRAAQLCVSRASGSAPTGPALSSADDYIERAHNPNLQRAVVA